MTIISNQAEVVFSFDTTGSMYPCLTQVRRKVSETVRRLMRDIPGIRIGIIAHGDYCDDGHPYVVKALDLTSDEEAIVRFVNQVQATGGGDSPECYEQVLVEAQRLSWSPGYQKVLVLIGDDVPHHPGYRYGSWTAKDWRQELAKLQDREVVVYGVQALNRRHAAPFYNELAVKSGGFHISLDQFSYITDLVLAVCYKQAGDAQLEQYENEVVAQNRMTRGLSTIFDTMMGRHVPVRSTFAVEEPEPYEYGGYHGSSRSSYSKPRVTSTARPSSRFAEADLRAVPSGRFQVLDVDHDTDIKSFVTDSGALFKRGRGFYEFMKTETIQAKKEVILMDRRTGDFFGGEQAREMLGLPKGESIRLKPTDLDKYMVFVQSTSANRKLIGGTKFLYEVEDWDRVEA